MDLPQELEVWYVIPSLRKELAVAMKNQGLKQVEIAKRLGLTKSAINQYISEKRGNEIKLNDKIKAEVLNSSKKINNHLDAIKELQNLIHITREEKIICQILSGAWMPSKFSPDFRTDAAASISAKSATRRASSDSLSTGVVS